MRKLTFYRQQRVDQGIRTGVEMDGETVLHRFEYGKGESDPALLWFIEIRCRGPKLPQTVDGARQWLLTHKGLIQSGLEQLADDLATGMDVDALPLQRTFPRAPPGTKMTLICSAGRRFQAIQIAGLLRKLAIDWEKHLRSLRDVSRVAL